MMYTSSQVVDAWQNMQPWVEHQLPGLATQEKLPDETQDLGDIGACDALNGGGGTMEVRWVSDGSASCKLTSLKIAALAGVAIQTATEVDASTVHLPFSFSRLEVNGTYSYRQPCGFHDMGKKARVSTADGHGTVTQAIDSNSLYYVVTTGDSITLDSVVVGGTPRVNMTPASGDTTSWIATLVKALGGPRELEGLRSKLQDVFRQADFAHTMIALLKQGIGARS